MTGVAPPPPRPGTIPIPIGLKVRGLIILAVLVAFAPVLGNGFVDWDDLDNFVNNPSFRGVGLSQAAWAWSTTILGVYQPLAWMAFGAESAAWGLDPRGYHATSL